MIVSISNGTANVIETDDEMRFSMETNDCRTGEISRNELLYPATYGQNVETATHTAVKHANTLYEVSHPWMNSFERLIVNELARFRYK